MVQSAHPQWLKPDTVAGPGGTAKEAAEKVGKSAKESPQALKRDTFSTTYGTAKAVPYPKPCVNQSFSPNCKAVPYPFQARSTANRETL
jgi:hypothetical protein